MEDEKLTEIRGQESGGNKVGKTGRAVGALRYDRSRKSGRRMEKSTLSRLLDKADLMWNVFICIIIIVSKISSFQVHCRRTTLPKHLNTFPFVSFNNRFSKNQSICKYLPRIIISTTEMLGPLCIYVT